MDYDIYNAPLFQRGDNLVIDKVLHEHPGKYNHYAKGDIIAMQGYACRNIYLLCGGSAYAKMTSEEGKELTLDTLNAPDVLASSFVFSTKGIFPVTIIAADACDIWVLSKDCILDIIKEDKAVMQNYLKVISDHSMFLSNRIAEFALQTLSTRIISYIDVNGALNNLQEAAFILGVARPSLSRAISQLVSQGILVKGESGYIRKR